MNYKPIIILGFPRSGTTLLRRILDTHPSISCPGETFLLRSAARFIRGEKVAANLDYGVLGGLSSLGIGSDELYSKLREFVSFFLEQHLKQGGKNRWAEKTAVDAFYIDEIESIFGNNAQFVCLVRHGLDVVSSCHDLTNSNEKIIDEFYPYIQQTRYLDSAYANAWVDSTNRLLSFIDKHPDNSCLIRYEDLLADPEFVMKELMQFLNEEWDQDLIDKGPSTVGHIGIGDWKTYEKNGFDKSSVERWRSMSSSVLKRTAPIVNPLLDLLGYESVNSDSVLADQTPEQALRRYEMLMMSKALKAKDSG